MQSSGKDAGNRSHRAWLAGWAWALLAGWAWALLSGWAWLAGWLGLAGCVQSHSSLIGGLEALLARRRRRHHHHRHHSFFTRPLTINGNSPLSTETLTCKANVFTPRLGPPGFNTRSRSDGVVYWMDGRIGWQAMACHPIDPPAIQCTTPLHLEQQYLQASWKGGSPCTTITGHHAPSSKRGCVRCLGILQSSLLPLASWPLASWFLASWPLQCLASCQLASCQLVWPYPS